MNSEPTGISWVDASASTSASTSASPPELHASPQPRRPGSAELRGALAAVLRARRRELGLSQRELAIRCGVANATISKIEQHKLSPTFDMLAKLAHGLDLGLDVLVGRVVREQRNRD